MTIQEKKLNVFSGSNSVQNFLDPENHDYTPLVEIPVELNPFYYDGVTIYAKLLNLLPLGNVKQIPAYHMLTKAKVEGKLDGIHTIVEASSGNMSIALTLIARSYGILNAKAYVSHSINKAKIQLLQLIGAEVVAFNEPTCPDPTARGNRIDLARQKGIEEGYFNPGQYDNPANPKAHELLTGKQIWEQTKKEVSVISVSLGTTGSAIGISQFLKARNKKIITVGTASDAELKTPGIRSVRQLVEIRHLWKNWVDYISEVNFKKSFESSLGLIRSGLMVGPSSGLTYAGLIQFLDEKKKNGTLETLRNDTGKIICVFVCGDGPLPYLDQYFKYLDQSYFRQIVNESILDIKNSSVNSDEHVYDREPEEVVTMLNKQRSILLDVRPLQDFKKTHLKNAQHQDFNTLMESNVDSCSIWKGKKVYVICKRGNNSKIATNKLRQMGVEAYNVKGGLEAWNNVIS